MKTPSFKEDFKGDVFESVGVVDDPLTTEIRRITVPTRAAAIIPTRKLCNLLFKEQNIIGI